MLNLEIQQDEFADNSNSQLELPHRGQLSPGRQNAKDSVHFPNIDGRVILIKPPLVEWVTKVALTV